MKRAVLLLCVAAGLLVLPVSQVWALHDAGVAHCDACHTMHNSEGGAMVDPNAPDGNAYLLKDETPSDVCLSCHGTRVWSADMMNPSTGASGNFAFMLEDNINDGHNGADNPIPGGHAVHNINAPSKNSVPDPVLTHAPGGTFPASMLGCTSCHDPHGNEHFRLLYGAGEIQDGIYEFTNAAPEAIGISRNSNETATAHTAYLGGMSDWCANCHGDFHGAGATLVHPAGEALGGTIANTYNLYNGTLDQSGGQQATAYLKDVPFEDPANLTNSTAGPSATSQVSCITCHRAHGSSAGNLGRWDFTISLLGEDGVESGSWAIPNPYTNPNQRSLCNKCHNKDEHDATDEIPWP